jgi:Ca2+-binding RTX toxin-like protein
LFELPFLRIKAMSTTLTLQELSPLVAAGGTLSAASLPTVSIVPPTANPTEGGPEGSFTITLSAPAPAEGLVVNLTRTGRKATPGPDDTPAAGKNLTAVTANSFTLAAGQTTDSLKVTAPTEGSSAVSAPQSASTLAASSGVILFQDNFDSGTLSPEWETIWPSQFVEDGWLHNVDTDDWPRDSEALVHDSDTSWRNYRLSLTADFVNGSPWEQFTVLFRTNNFNRSSAGTSGDAYQLAFYGVTGWTPGGEPKLKSFDLTRIRNGQPTLLVQEDWNSSETPTDIVVNVDGSHIQVSLNGASVIDLVDPDPLLFGGIGVHNIWESEGRYDNFIVKQVTVEDIVGTPGNDLLKGTTSADQIFGLAGCDTLCGLGGNDLLVGGAGKDKLWGGQGKDCFRFNTPNQGIDIIKDFTVAQQDKIQLLASGFSGLTAGTLASTAFRSGAGATSPTNSLQRLIYNTTSGALFFDADGNLGGFQTIQIATLTNKPSLSASNIVVI